MTYGLSALTQISNFLSASGLGLFLCVLYYTLVFLRSSVGEGKAAYFISDTIFSVLSAFALFIFFQLYTDGEIRPELLFSSALSFFVFRYCFRGLFTLPFQKGALIFSAFLKMLFAPLSAIGFLFKKIYKNFRKKEK